MIKLLILLSAVLAISVAAPPNNDRLPTNPGHGDHKDEPIAPIEDLSTLTKSSEEKRKELEKELGIHRERRDHHEGHEKSNEKHAEKPHDDHVSGGDKKAQVQAKPLSLKHEETNKHEHHKRDVVADKQPEKTAAVLVHEKQHSPHGIALKDPLAKPEEKKENPSSCQCKKEKRDVHELPGASCHCQKEKRDIPRPEDDHKQEQKPNEHPHDDQKDIKKQSSEESSEEKNKNTKLHLSQRQKRDIHELVKEHDGKAKKSSSEESSSNESKEENKSGSTTTTTTTGLPALSAHNNQKRDLPVPTVPKHEHPASSEAPKAEANKDGKPQVEDLGSHIPPSAKPIHAHTATLAHTTHDSTIPGQHPLINNEPKPISSLRPHVQA